MKYVIKPPATDKELSVQLLSSGWQKIWEPRSLATASLLSLPFAFLSGGIPLGLAYLLKPGLFYFISSESLEITLNINFPLLLFIAVIFVYMLLHELTHAVFIPNFAKSEKTFWGMNGLFGFVFTSEPIKTSPYFAEHNIPVYGKTLKRGFIAQLLRNPVYVQADMDIYEYFKVQGAKTENDAEDFTGEFSCYLYGFYKHMVQYS